MKVTYEFDTCSESFDQQELNRVQNADNLASCVWDIQQQLRSWYKHDERGSIPVDEICDKIDDIIKDNNIDIDKLWS